MRISESRWWCGLKGPLWLLAFLASAGAAIAVVLQRRPAATQPAALADTDGPAAPSDDPPADWCAPGLDPIAGGACFASAADPRARPLLIYLHGRYAPDAAGEEIDRQRRLAARATARGFAVLVLRGRPGVCTAQELATWFCWPSNERNADTGASVVQGWGPALAVAQARAGSDARFLLGFSNGGYFAGLIATRGLLEVDALVVAHGGPVEPVRALGRKPPLLLLSGDDDIAQDEMIRFDEELSRELWPHDAYARFGGHGLADEDIDSALAFFSRAREPLPLDPPLPLHRAVRHVRESGDGPRPELAPVPSGDSFDGAPYD